MFSLCRRYPLENQSGSASLISLDAVKVHSDLYPTFVGRKLR